jgi:hypothetical protein
MHGYHGALWGFFVAGDDDDDDVALRPMSGTCGDDGPLDFTLQGGGEISNPWLFSSNTLMRG